MKERPSIPDSVVVQFMTSSRERILARQNPALFNRRHVRDSDDLPYSNPAVKGNVRNEQSLGNPLIARYGEDGVTELQEKLMWVNEKISRDEKKRLAAIFGFFTLYFSLASAGSYLQDKEWNTAIYASSAFISALVATHDFRTYKALSKKNK